MRNWDPEVTRRRFAAVAWDARNSMAKVCKGIWLRQHQKADSTDLKDLYDALLAKWSVYDALARSPCLESREEFIAEAAAKRASGPDGCPPGAYDEGNFLRHWKLYMEALMAEQGTDGPGSSGAAR